MTNKLFSTYLYGDSAGARHMGFRDRSTFRSWVERHGITFVMDNGKRVYRKSDLDAVYVKQLKDQENTRKIDQHFARTIRRNAHQLLHAHGL